MKQCAKCKEFLPLTEFHHHRSSPDGRYSYCKECRYEYRRRGRRTRPPLKQPLDDILDQIKQLAGMVK